MNLRLTYTGAESMKPFILPCSKSIAARALIINALHPKKQDLDIPADNDDIAVILDALASDHDVVDVHASGTALRLLTSYYAIRPGEKHILTGTPRLLSRPMAPLIEVLRKLGAEIAYTPGKPIEIIGKKLSSPNPGRPVDIDATVSSQFITSLLLVAPYIEGGLKLRLAGSNTPVSQPYIEMTLALLRQAGFSAAYEYGTISVEPIKDPSLLQAPEFIIEKDWSAASYAYELRSICNLPIATPGLVPYGKSLQGDSALCLLPWPTLTGNSDNNIPFRRDFTDMPDVVPAFVTALCAAGREFLITGVGNLRLKECDRLEALRTELRKCGFILQTDQNSISWDGTRCEPDAKIEIDTYDDHRIAMALAPMAYYHPGMIIRDAQVVEKSFPDFWNQLEKRGFSCERIG